jgi:hypothetical protein
MDKRISTLIFIYAIYLIVAVCMVLFTHVQQVLTMLLFGGGGIGILLIFYFIWQHARTKE